MNNAKTSVIKNYPKAYARQWPQSIQHYVKFNVTRPPEVVIYTPLWRGIAIIGRGTTEVEAWQDAVNFGSDTSKR